MSLFWPLLIVLATLLVLTMVLLVGAGFFSGTRQRTSIFWCPFREQDVLVDFREMVWEGRLVDVSECTYFNPPTAVICEKRCLGLTRFPRARSLSHHRAPAQLRQRIIEALAANKQRGNDPNDSLFN